MKRILNRLGTYSAFLPFLLCVLFFFFLPELFFRLQHVLFLSDSELIGYSVPYTFHLAYIPLGLIGGSLFLAAALAPRQDGKLPLRWKLTLPAYLLVLALAVYTLTVSITTMTEKGLTVYAPLTPGGTSYSYAEIISVETGYLNRDHQHGVLYYRVHLSDGTSSDLLGEEPSS